VQLMHLIVDSVDVVVIASSANFEELEVVSRNHQCLKHLNIVDFELDLHYELVVVAVVVVVLVVAE